MARPRILDQSIISKIARKTGKNDSSIGMMVSRKASKHSISAEAALVVLAKENGIGVSTYQRSLDAAKQTEIRGVSLSVLAHTPARNITSNFKPGNRTKAIIDQRASLKFTIEYLIEDEELRSRCQDILMAADNFDRPINQATLVLEDRIRKKAKPVQKLVGDQLVGYSFNEDISKTVLRVASNDSDDQRGATQMLRGVFPTFRNKTHHHIIKNISREEAMRVCGFIDVLLRIVDNSVKIK